MCIIIVFFFVLFCKIHNSIFVFGFKRKQQKKIDQSNGSNYWIIIYKGLMFKKKSAQIDYCGPSRKKIWNFLILPTKHPHTHTQSEKFRKKIHLYRNHYQFDDDSINFYLSNNNNNKKWQRKLYVKQINKRQQKIVLFKFSAKNIFLCAFVFVNVN